VSQRWFIIILALSLSSFLDVKGQRAYAPNSVLSTGNWLKISIDSPGIYKVSGAMLKNAGFSGQISSSSIRLFGNGGSVLPASNKSVVIDDLRENAIFVNDGEDGIFDASDYFLFYAPGPNRWSLDSSIEACKYIKNPYSSSAFYFINAGNSSGKRIGSLSVYNSTSDTVYDFIDHYHYENDRVNFLKSGREWYGEEFDAQNGQLEKKFSLPFAKLISGKPMFIRSEVIGRSAIQNNLISVSINGIQIAEHNTAPVNFSLVDPVASISSVSKFATNNSSSIEVGYKFNPGSVNAKAWLNYFEVHVSRTLDMKGLSQFQFNRVSSGATMVKAISFAIANPTASFSVWDVTNNAAPVSIKSTIVNGFARFNALDTGIRQYIVFDPSEGIVPKVIGKVSNQNLHALPVADMIIVTDKALISQAERLALFHRKQDGLSVNVTDIGMIYNEFSSGSTDPTAIRNYVKMFYDRAGTVRSAKPKYLLLFGGASYAFRELIGSDKNKVPAYQSESSLDPLTSYVTDDYFGFLDDQDDIEDSKNIPELDIGIGRIPARTIAQAKQAVDKIISYHNTSNFGSWRNDIALIADDEDFNIHLNDAEFHADEIADKVPALNIKKIYLDAYQQESGTAGNKYPQVVEQIDQAIDRGLLILNYSGHGGSSRLAQEAILDKTTISKWSNSEKLPLIITATCDFAPFDDLSQFSIGEELLMGGPNGAIALLTTTRLVFASSNRVINNNYFKFSLSRDSLGKYPSLGAALRDAKNYTVKFFGDYVNARKFVLLGDPAMKLALPEFQVRSTTINGKPISVSADTLKSLNKYEISGEVLNPEGRLASDFNGYVYPIVYDKPLKIKTRANDTQSIKVDFNSTQNILYIGKVKAINGKFSFSFIVPNDIDLNYGTSKISYYAENEIYDASGADIILQTGGIGLGARNDGSGPRLTCFLNDSSFKDGGTVGQNPVLHIKMEDASGINFSQLGIGHEMTVTLDQDFRKTYFLNDLFKIDKFNSSIGEISYPFFGIPEGSHQLEARVWDVFNNASTCKINFKVVPEKVTNILSFACFPNPVVNQTVFTYATTGLSGPAEVELQVLNSLGQPVFLIKKSVYLQSGQLNEIFWDGIGSNGNAVQRGVYFCRILVKNAAGNLQQNMLKIIKF
jgi:hypothetical protein